MLVKKFVLISVNVCVTCKIFLTTQRNYLKLKTLIHRDKTHNAFSRIFDKRLRLNSIAITMRFIDFC